jgi:hypothetical protein
LAREVLSGKDTALDYLSIYSTGLTIQIRHKVLEHDFISESLCGVVRLVIKLKDFPQTNLQQDKT